MNNQRLTFFALTLGFMLYFIECPVWAQNHEIVTGDINYHNKDKNVTGFLARPADNQKHPALILIHEWWGLNENIRDNARAFAKLGYVALAVDLYNGKSATTPPDALKLVGEVKKNMDKAFENLQQAVNFLKEQPDRVIPDRLASVGWCFGGGWSYRMAKNNLGVKASVIYYGVFNPKDDLSKMRATIIGHFADNDRLIRVDTVREFQARLKTLNGDHEIYIYPNTEHGFANPKGAKGQIYNKEAAELAWKRTVDFLKKYL